MKKKQNKSRILITLVLGLILVILFYAITSAITKYTGFFVSEKPFEKDKDFRNCLKEKSITLYINTENPSETLRNIETMEYLDNVKVFNCLRDNQFCLNRGINSFPSWEINKNKIEKDISILELSDLTGCEKL